MPPRFLRMRDRVSMAVAAALLFVMLLAPPVILPISLVLTCLHGLLRLTLPVTEMLLPATAGVLQDPLSIIPWFPGFRAIPMAPVSPLRFVSTFR